MNIGEFWDNVDSHTSPAIRKNFSALAIPLLQALLLEIFKGDSVDVGFCIDGKKTYSMVTYDPLNTDKQLSLRLHAGGKFDLYFECYEEDNYAYAAHVLTGQDLLLIPKGLKDLMGKVRKIKTSIGAYKKTLQLGD